MAINKSQKERLKALRAERKEREKIAAIKQKERDYQDGVLAFDAAHRENLDREHETAMKINDDIDSTRDLAADILAKKNSINKARKKSSQVQRPNIQSSRFNR